MSPSSSCNSIRHLLAISAVDNAPAITSIEIPRAVATAAAASALDTWWAPMSRNPTASLPCGVTRSKCARPSRISISAALTSSL